jgi:hypothetical protein
MLETARTTTGIACLAEIEPFDVSRLTKVGARGIAQNRALRGWRRIGYSVD